MKRKALQGLGLLVLATMIAGLGCGGSTAGKEYTLDVEGSMSVVAAAGMTASVGKDIPTPQVLIGTTIVEVTDDAAEELGVRLTDLDVGPQETVNPELRLGLTPGSTLSGVIFKVCDLGIPFGQSYLDLDLVVSAPTTVVFIETADTPVLEGNLLHLGTFEALADDNDRTRLPLLGEIPIINFLFQGQQHQATVESLIIVLTPQIISDTEG